MICPCAGRLLTAAKASIRACLCRRGNVFSLRPVQPCGRSKTASEPARQQDLPARGGRIVGWIVDELIIESKFRGQEIAHSCNRFPGSYFPTRDLTAFPSPIRMPRPPALKKAWWTPEMPLITPATPTVSSGLPHCLPESETPACTVRSMSVKSQGSFRSVGPARAREHTEVRGNLLLQVRGSRPGQLWYLRTALMSAGWPVAWGQCNCVRFAAHAAAFEIARDLELAGLAPTARAAPQFPPPARNC